MDRATRDGTAGHESKLDEIVLANAIALVGGPCLFLAGLRTVADDSTSGAYHEIDRRLCWRSRCWAGRVVALLERHRNVGGRSGD